MTTKEVIFGGFSIVIIIMSLIQITPLKINPWGWLFKLLKLLAKSIGSAMNEDIYAQLDEIKLSQQCLKEDISKVDANLKDFEDKTEKDELKNKRSQILKFYNEEYRGIQHSREEFDNINETYEEYEDLIERKGLKNGKIDKAYSYITKRYKENESNHSFIQ